jgi:hypothetical protein
MAVIRQENWLGQQRVDANHLRSLESGVAGDMDVLAGSILAGRQALVVRGFTIVSTNITQAEDLQIKVAHAALIHFFAAVSGSIFEVPLDRANEVLDTVNPRVSGGFTPSRINYIGVDLRRLADNTTVDQVVFLDANTSTEDPKLVPLAKTEDYRIIIQTVDFSLTPGICPIAKVTTGPSNNIVLIEDARNLFFRLGSGGTDPDNQHSYNWPAGRNENSSSDPFVGGDKAIASLKDWTDAVSTRLWETGGGEFWYSPTADRNIKMIRHGSQFANGEWFSWDGTNLHWKGLVFIFENSTAVFNEVANQTTSVAGLTDLADGECVYVDLDRSQNRTIAGLNPLVAVKASLAVLGQGTPPGSRWVLAWRYGADVFTRDQSYPVNSSFNVATVTSTGAVKLSASDPAVPVGPRVATVDTFSNIALAGGLSRGDAAGPGADFFGGSGDLTIGGFSHDFNVQIATTRTQDTTSIQGRQRWTTSANATLEVWNLDDFIAHPENLTAKFKGVNSGTALLETAQNFEAAGAMGFRNVVATPVTPTPTANDPIRSKMFFQTNGQVTPNTRDQLCVMWFDGAITVISESNPY